MDEGNSLRLPDLLAEVNAHVYALAERSELESREWEFVCECGQPLCRARVKLSLAEYEELRGHGGPLLARGHRHRPILAPGHLLSQKQRARELRGEARALQAEAKQQLERARRNRRDVDDRQTGA